MGIIALLRRVHIWIYAYIEKKVRTRIILKQYREAHAVEIRNTPFYELPIVLAKHGAEIDLIKAGKLVATDRQSWPYPFMPASVQRLATPVLKATPYNLRRMSRTPVPRRAINLIKGALISQDWDIRPIKGVEVDDEDDQAERIKIAKAVFNHPNNDDSFQTFMEKSLEDFLIYGGMPVELRLTIDPKRPVKMWPVNVESIRIFVSWMESTPDMPRYAQMTGLKGERGAILFYDDDMMYLRDNPATDSPFGVGKMEVAFQSINDFLGVQGMAGRSGSDQVHKTWLWWEQPQSEAHFQIVRRHIQNELEGQAKISLIGGMKKPDVLEVNPVVTQDLLLEWQEMLIRMIANAFEMSAMALGVEHDVNRAVGEVLDDKDFRSAVVPVAKRLEYGYTRKVLHGKLQWKDLEFVFLNLDDPDRQSMSELLAKMYSANALSANEFRNKMGFEPMDTPFADLTQFELMMLNLMIGAQIQQQQAQQQQKMQQDQQDRQMKQQQDMMDQQPMPGTEMPGGPQMAQPGMPGQKMLGPGGMPGGGMPGGGGAMSKQPGATPPDAKQPKAPQKLSLPKFPISGSKWNAQQIAQMPLNQIADAISSGQLPDATQLVQDMTDQEPDVLEQMSDEVQQYLDDRMKKQAKKTKSKLTPQMLRKWLVDQKRRYGKAEGRQRNFADWLVEYGVTTGRPGASGGDTRPSRLGKGRPGLQ